MPATMNCSTPTGPYLTKGFSDSDGDVKPLHLLSTEDFSELDNLPETWAQSHFSPLNKDTCFECP